MEEEFGRAIWHKTEVVKHFVLKRYFLIRQTTAQSGYALTASGDWTGQ